MNRISLAGWLSQSRWWRGLLGLRAFAGFGAFGRFDRRSEAANVTD